MAHAFYNMQWQSVSFVVLFANFVWKVCHHRLFGQAMEELSEQVEVENPPIQIDEETGKPIPVSLG
jgi:hypothetical protein